MDAITLTKVKALNKLELLIAFIKCFDNNDGNDNCCGCPLFGEAGCAYDLKIEIAERLIGSDPDA